nr:MAG TPA: hypothetical protein [Caudoviricetes sp.]
MLFNIVINFCHRVFSTFWIKSHIIHKCIIHVLLKIIVISTF